ncbi:Ig-like domain repeat protein [Terriglobus saanensis]|uniref:Ig-like domain repeat protein n=1 Tax=Terriglobus saanensis TaxID=870903 RepID=UPI0016513209|nr:Ig-like domain repeat protein [Terriglobus saanensis]
MVLFCVSENSAEAQRTAISRALVVVDNEGAQDLGPAPGSAAVSGVVVTLKRSAAQQADLDSFLTNASTPGATGYHHFLTTEEFAARFQPSSASVDALSAWFSEQGLTVGAVSRARTSMLLSGTVAQMNAVFAVGLHRMSVASAEVLSATEVPSLPDALAASVTDVRGMNAIALNTDASSALDLLAAQVDANVSAVLVVKGVCTGSAADALADGFLPLLEQAAAQGQTVLVSGDCVTAALSPAATALATAVHGSADTQAVSLAVEGDARPSWQSVVGLPSGSIRAVPDLSSDPDALSTTLQTIVASAGVRQGAVNAILYSLAPVVGLYTQDAGVATGTWETATGLGQVDLKALIKAWPMGTGTTSVSISSSNYAPVHGTSFTLTATVTGTSTTTVPTGTVTFSSAQGGTLGSSALDSTGVATYVVSGVAAGSYDFKAVYGGDGVYAPATTASTAGVTVLGEPTMLSAVVASGATVGGTFAVTVTAKSASGIGTPSGSASVTPQGTSTTVVYTGALSSTVAGTATGVVNVLATQAGSVTLLVGCNSADVSFTCYTPVSVQATIAKATPGVVASYSTGVTAAARRRAAALETTSTGTVSATVSSSSTSVIPTGNVQFLDGTTVLGTGILANGVATLPVALTGAGHSITAVYAGDANFLTATSAAVAATGTLVTTTTSLASSASTSTYGTSLTLTSVVTPASLVDATAPTGTITFTDSLQGVVGTATLSAGTATLALTTLNAGSHSLVATYSGDTNYAASTSTTTVTVAVTAATGSLTATLSSTAAIGYGTAASISATVLLTSTGTATGSVTAMIAGVSGAVYKGVLTAGVATIAINAPPPGTYTVTVACTASINLTCSNTVTLTLKVVVGPTVTMLTVVPSAPQAGYKTTLTATVGPAVATTATLAAVTGTVSFTDNGISIGTGIVTNGTATLAVALAGGKSHALLATYSGDANYASSVSPSTIVTPLAIDSTIALTANTVTPLAGANVTLTATLTEPTGALIIPTGLVTFYDTLNGTTRKLGTAMLVSNGVNAAVAVFSSTNYTAGTHSAYAIYAGDGSYNTITSGQLLISVGDFTLTMNPATMTISQGHSGQAVGLLTTVSGFTGTVTFGCTPPANTLATCSFSPSSLTGGGATTLTISTTADATSLMRNRPRGGSGWPTGVALGALSMAFFARRSRMRSVLLALLLSMAALGAWGCSSGTSTTTGGSTTIGGGTPIGTGSPLGTSSFTLTTAATDGSTTVRHNYSYQVTIQ